jgi:hypothetical protein
MVCYGMVLFSVLTIVTAAPADTQKWLHLYNIFISDSHHNKHFIAQHFRCKASLIKYMQSLFSII